MSEIDKLMQQTIYLKKSLKKCRSKQQNQQREINDLRAIQQQNEIRIKKYQTQYQTLLRKYQNEVAMQQNTNSTFIMQVQQLKQMIEDKQRQIEQFQLRIIPNLDQDMLRVKLVSEMQGPYQQNISKKQQEIHILRDKLIKSQRKVQLLQFQLKYKTHALQQEIQNNNKYYQQENLKLMDQVSHLLSKNQIQCSSNQFIKKQTFEIQTLNDTCEMLRKSQKMLEFQLQNVRQQRNILHQKLKDNNLKQMMNNKNILDNDEKKKLKQAVDKLQMECTKWRQECARLGEKVDFLQRQSRRKNQEIERQRYTSRDNYQLSVEQLKRQIQQLTEQLRTVKYNEQAKYDQNQRIVHQYESVKRQFTQKTKQYEKLLMKLQVQQNTISEYEYRFRQKRQFDVRKRTNKEEQNSAKKGDYEGNQEKMLRTKVEKLEEKVQKLTTKLNYANNKIVQLIREKTQISPNRQRIASQYHNQMPISQKQVHRKNAFLLQFRDSSLQPVIQPAIFTYNDR